MKITIKSIYSSVKFEGDFTSLKDALNALNKSHADLSGADLSGADLIGANLIGANLSVANLSVANLSGANLIGADLIGADLIGANLSGADLRDANLIGANLSVANLSGANLIGANLIGANLIGAKNSEFAIAQTRILPEGDLIGWKKCRDSVIVKLLIKSNIKRSHAFGRKCRAESAEVLEIFGAKIGISGYNPDFIYRAGEIVKPLEKFDNDFQNECASGIHFFITRVEAENYNL